MTLPRPRVDVTTDTESIEVIISREGDSKQYRYKGEGKSEGARAQDAVKKMIEDTSIAEILPAGKKF